MPSTAQLEWVGDRMGSGMGWVGKEGDAKGNAKLGSR